MPGINNRVFGSDIDVRIKKKLEARQLLAEKDRNPLESIQPSQYPDDQSAYYTHGQLNDLNFDGVADLSSRTPFVRMWTAIEIRSHENDGDPYDEKDISDEKLKLLRKNPRQTYSKTDKGIQIKNIISNERIVYEIGNHINNEFSDVLNQRQGDTLSGVNSTDVIPNVFETNNNEFMKPAAGITSITSNTEGMLGAIKKTTVNFVVHNFHDYDKIYSRYFLRPGAQIFVDFGWDSLKQLYKPQEIIDKSKYNSINRGETIEEILFGEKGYVTDANGDLETSIGLVTNFDSKVKENGSVECSLEIVSKNTALIENNIDARLKTRILFLLDAEIMSYASQYFKAYQKEGVNLLDPNWSNSADNINYFTDKALMFAAQHLKGEGNIPTKNSTKTGVYWQAGDVNGKKIPGSTKNIYISFGLLEDKILNGEFGLGTDLINILGHNIENKDSGNFEVSFDSSNSYIRWDLNLFQRQVHEKDAKKISYLYPNKWGETYNTDRKKTSIWRDNFFVGYNNDEMAELEKDNFNKMPIRELFISSKVIKDAFNDSDTIKEAIEFILNRINRDSQDIFDLKIASTKRDNTKLSIIDRNLLEIESDGKKDFFEKLFLFKPMSKNSIVKSYDLSISIPKGELQSMLAIQTLPSGRGLFPLSEITDKYLALNMNSQHESRRDGDNSDIGVVYLPEIGAYQANRMDDINALETNISFNFDNDKFLNDSGVEYAQLLDGAAVSLAKGGDIKDAKVDTTNDITDAQLAETKFNVKLASSISEFYLLQARNSSVEKIPTLLSIANLSLTIYGISSLVPGDLFRVDYLPERQRKLFYFQVTKVTHNVNSSTWSTSLETVPRIRPEEKKNSGLYQKLTNVALSFKLLKGICDKSIEQFEKRIRVDSLRYIDKGVGEKKLDYVFEFEGTEDENPMGFWGIEMTTPYSLTLPPTRTTESVKTEKENEYNITYNGTGGGDTPNFEFKITGIFENSLFLKNKGDGMAVNETLDLFYKFKVRIKKDEKYKILVKNGAFAVIPSEIYNDNYDTIAKYFTTPDYIPTAKTEQENMIYDKVQVYDQSEDLKLEHLADLTCEDQQMVTCADGTCSKTGADGCGGGNEAEATCEQMGRITCWDGSCSDLSGEC